MMFPVCAVGEIRDGYGFVVRCLGRSGVRARGEEYEEMVCEGMVILCDLAQRYDPARDTGPQASFAGYAWYLLPRKLKDAWHKLHPEHVLRTRDDGKRRYEYYETPVSIDERSTDSEDPYLDKTGYRVPGEFVTVPPTA